MKYCNLKKISLFSLKNANVSYIFSPKYQGGGPGGVRCSVDSTTFLLFYLQTTTKFLTKSISIQKKFKSIIYNFKNVEWFSYFDPKFVTFRTYKCFFWWCYFILKYIYGVFIKLKLPRQIPIRLVDLLSSEI